MSAVFVSTAAPRAPRGLWEILDACRGAGLERVELGFAEFVPGPDLVERLRSTGLELVVHNYFPPPREEFVLNLASADPGVVTSSLRLVLAALELSARLEAPFYSVHSGFVTDPVGFDGTSFILPLPDSEAQVEAARQRFLEGIDRALDRAEELGVRLLVENSVCTEELAGKLLLLTADEFADLFDAFAGRDLGMLLDTGHLNVTAQTVGFDRLAFVDAVAPHVEAFHLHDNDGVVDEHLPPGDGSWALDVIERPELRPAVVTIEARFDDVPALAAYARRLDARLAAAEAAR